MAEYIEREELLKDISESVVFSVKEGEPSLEIRGANKITDRIKAAPAADVVEVVHGEWLETKYPNVYQCSECYYEWYVTGICRKTPIDNDAFYCPCCGAEMDAERKCEDG